jgi:hypothetical protein
MSEKDPKVNPLIVDHEGKLVDMFGIPQIHPDYFKNLPVFAIGDLVTTADGKLGIITTDHNTDGYGISFYEVLVEDRRIYYSILQLKKFEKERK